MLVGARGVDRCDGRSEGEGVGLDINSFLD